MQPVQSSCWANTNCDRQQQMRNGTHSTINTHSTSEWKMQWMTTLQLHVTNVLISNNNECSTVLLLSATKTGKTEKCESKRTRNAKQMKLFVCMERQQKENGNGGKRDRETSSTLLKYLNYACSARRTHYAWCHQCMIFVLFVCCCGMPRCKWTEHITLNGIP